MNKPIVKGSIVRYKDGWCRVSACFKNSVNLCGIFNKVIYHKKIDIKDVTEDYDAWYAAWTKSETYYSH